MKSSNNYNKQLYARNAKQTITAVAVIIVVVLVGVRLLVGSHAQSPYVAGNANQGSLSTGASQLADPTASDGQRVQFGSPLAIHVSNGNLVNGSGQTIRLLGADETSTEEYCVTQDRLSLGALNQAEADGIASWHMNAIRIPLNEDCWLGINGAPANVSGDNYQIAIKNFVRYLNNDGIYAILDLQYNAPGTTLSTGGAGMPDEDHAPAFWASVATTFKTNPAVIYDLYNEPALDSYDPAVYYDPNSADWACWLNGCTGTIGTNTFQVAGMQQLVNTVRATGATQPILLGSLNVAGDPCGYEDSDSNNAGSCMIVKDKPTDPLNQLIVDFHNYWGVTSGIACSNVTCWNNVLGQLKAAGLPWVTTELGEYDCSPQYMNTYMNWADQNNMSYMAWAWIVNDGPNGGYTTCTPGTSDYENLELLSTWSGAASTVAPQGANFKAHLLAVSPY